MSTRKAYYYNKQHNKQQQDLKFMLLRRILSEVSLGRFCKIKLESKTGKRSTQKYKFHQKHAYKWIPGLVLKTLNYLFIGAYHKSWRRSQPHFKSLETKPEPFYNYNRSRSRAKSGRLRNRGTFGC